ncbi:MAG: hypothetical protein GQ583_04315 [Methyloprofundus sp.]|nr:hypothetical protein [Methyloprofundus sp.]
MTNGISSPSWENTSENRRKAIRYSPRSKKAIIKLKQLLRPNIYIHIKIINISSKGARISSRYTLSIKTKVILNLQTKDGTIWKVPAKVIRLYNNEEYGILFDAIQHDLIDQLMKNETDFSLA